MASVITVGKRIRKMLLQPQIVDEKWYQVDGPQGTEWVMADYVGEVDLSEFDDGGEQPIPTMLRDFCDNDKAYNIQKVNGFGARMSASGYMDATDWCVFLDETEAYEYLAETYDLCPGCLGEIGESQECPYC